MGWYRDCCENLSKRFGSSSVGWFRLYRTTESSVGFLGSMVQVRRQPCVFVHSVTAYEWDSYDRWMQCPRTISSRSQHDWISSSASPLYPQLSIDSGSIFGRFDNYPILDNVLAMPEKVGLLGKERMLITKLSKGYQQRGTCHAYYIPTVFDLG